MKLFGRRNRRPPLQAGQEWYYQTRSVEPTSTLVIGRIEKREGGTVVHVSVRGLRVRNPSSGSGVACEIAHMPFSEQALLESITELKGKSSPDIDFESGYEQWLEGTGGEGAFALTVAEAISHVEETVTEGSGRAT